jgi:hypothetical protein
MLWLSSFSPLLVFLLTTLCTKVLEGIRLIGFRYAIVFLITNPSRL